MPIKNYPDLEGIQPPLLKEPQAVYGLSANDIRTEMIREVLRIDDTNLLREALNYLRSLTVPVVQYPPCCYTQEELNKQLDQAEQEAQLGLGYEHDELKKMRPQWRLG